jgi:hypothetical protein
MIEEVLNQLQYIPLHLGWVGAAIGAVAGLAGSKAGEQPSVQARGLSQDEMDIINRMEELSLGNEELGERYSEISRKAMVGDYSVSPGLERDLAEQEQKLGVRIEEAGAPSTAAAQARGEFAESRGVQRGEARREMMQLGEQLQSARTARLTGAGQAALAPLARKREEGLNISTMKAATKASERAAMAGLVGQVAGSYAAGRGKTDKEK